MALGSANTMPPSKPLSISVFVRCLKLPFVAMNTCLREQLQQSRHTFIQDRESNPQVGLQHYIKYHDRRYKISKMG